MPSGPLRVLFIFTFMMNRVVMCKDCKDTLLHHRERNFHSGGVTFRISIHRQRNRSKFICCNLLYVQFPLSLRTKGTRESFERIYPEEKQEYSSPFIP